MLLLRTAAKKKESAPQLSFNMTFELGFTTYANSKDMYKNLTGTGQGMSFSQIACVFSIAGLSVPLDRTADCQELHSWL
jgi:hypothetical protein